MIDMLLAVSVAVTLVAAPLLWRIWYDRQAARGMVLRANVDAAVRRALGGESFVSVSVVPSTAWKLGRVILSAPTGYAWLIDRSWKAAAATTPLDYELVIRGASAPPPSITTPSSLKVAA